MWTINDFTIWEYDSIIVDLYNNFLLQENISQSLAGRIAYLILLPFSVNEIEGTGKWDINELLFRGSYPPIYDQTLETNLWYSN